MRRLAWLLTPVLALMAYGAGALPIPAVTVSMQGGGSTPPVLTPVPEPTTLGLVSLGLAGLALAGRRRSA
jgi:hypothetical protein